jgi:DNA-directed RNA polymerase subunit M/transcription elongation factor TFIIS
MIFAAARLRTNLVTCVSCTRTSDSSHEHVVSLKVETPAGHTRHVTVNEAEAELRHPLGERYLAHAPKSGNRTEIVLGACPICHEKPHMRLKDGGRIEDLTKCSSDGD